MTSHGLLAFLKDHTLSPCYVQLSNQFNHTMQKHFFFPMLLSRNLLSTNTAERIGGRIRNDGIRDHPRLSPTFSCLVTRRNAFRVSINGLEREWHVLNESGTTKSTRPLTLVPSALRTNPLHCHTFSCPKTKGGPPHSSHVGSTPETGCGPQLTRTPLGR